MRELKQQQQLRERVTSATFGVIFVYPVAKLPQEVSMTWQLFISQLTSLPAATTDEAGSLPASLETADPVLRWQNFLTNPKIPAMLTAPPPPAVPRITIPVVSGLCAAVFLGAVAAGLRQGGDRSTRIKCVASRSISLVAGLSALPSASASFANPLARNVPHGERTNTRRISRSSRLMRLDAAWKVTQMKVLDQQRIDKPLGSGAN